MLFRFTAKDGRGPPATRAASYRHSARGKKGRAAAIRRAIPGKRPFGGGRSRLPAQQETWPHSRMATMRVLSSSTPTAPNTTSSPIT